MLQPCATSLYFMFCAFWVFSKVGSLFIPCLKFKQIDGQPRFSFHFCLPPCCIEFRTRTQSSLVHPDRTSVSIRERYWCASVSVCLQTSLDSRKRNPIILYNQPHSTHVWKCSIILFWWLCWTWLLTLFFNFISHLLNYLQNFSYPLPEDWGLLHIHLTMWGHMMNSWCAESQHNMKKRWLAKM